MSVSAENKKSKYHFARNVIKSFTVRTVCMDIWLVFILPPTPRLARSVTKNVTIRTVCRNVRPMCMIS